jgi:hypothetical protein
MVCNVRFFAFVFILIEIMLHNGETTRGKKAGEGNLPQKG